ncbi:MAG: acyl carrier protein [Ruminococcus sp.]|jgi:acyl carrier protein|nr:acyl carrier protein [Ruminococcus sp.]MCR5075497.1 acyl carrier protein [Ruminococcus sp.]
MERLEKIIAIIRKIGELTIKEDMVITGDTDIISDLRFDSLDMVMIADEIEETFGVTIENDMIQEIRTVNDVNEKLSILLGE